MEQKIKTACCGPMAKPVTTPVAKGGAKAQPYIGGRCDGEVNEAK